MRKILVLKDIPQYKEQISKAAPGFDIIFTKSKEDAQKHLADSEIIVGWSSAVEKALRNENESIKWIQSTSAGVDDLPLALLKEKNIILSKATGVHQNQLSESIFGQILAFERKIKQSILLQEKATWNTELVANGMGELHNKTIGILGAGQIGQEVAKVASGFSMYTIGLKRSKNPVPYMDEIFTMNEIKDFVKRCDYIVNLLPSTPETIGLFNKELFDEMEDLTSLFNFGRGDAVVMQDLIEALGSGKLKYAGLDVTSPEPLPANSPLWGMDNVIITPHIAGRTPYYFDRLFDSFVDSLKEYLENKPIGKAQINFDTKY